MTELFQERPRIMLDEPSFPPGGSLKTQDRKFRSYFSRDATLHPPLVGLRSALMFRSRAASAASRLRDSLPPLGANNEADLKSLIALRAFIRPPPSFLSLPRSSPHLHSPTSSPGLFLWSSGPLGSRVSSGRQEGREREREGRREDSLCHHHGAPWLLGG